jgi:hypothetical protein
MSTPHSSQAPSPVATLLAAQDKPDEPTTSSSIFMLPNGNSHLAVVHHQMATTAQQPQVKKCVYHNRQCCRNHQISANQHQQDLHKRQGASNVSGAATTGSAPRTPYTRDAISTNVQPQYNAALIADRYLLMELVEGSTMYKCLDIRTQEELVCKVSRM